MNSLDLGQNRHVCLYSYSTVTTPKKINVNSVIALNIQYLHPKYILYPNIYGAFFLLIKIKSRFTHCFSLLNLFTLSQYKTSYYFSFFLTLNPVKSPVVLKNVPHFRFICFFSPLLHSSQTFPAGTSNRWCF